MPLEQINKAIKQLEFLKDLPDQDKVIDTIRNSLGPDFGVAVYSEPYLTQVILVCSYNFWDKLKFELIYKYKQGNSHNHKSRVLMNILIKARNYYDIQTLST